MKRASGSERVGFSFDRRLSDQPTVLAAAPRLQETPRRTQLAGFPPDLLAQSARRLRTGALLYAFVFFMNNPLPAILFPDERERYLASVLHWAPSIVSITAALVIAGLTWNRGIPVATILVLGLVFEVIGSFGIAAAQYLDVTRWAAQPPWAGLSWVAIWMLGFTVMMPTPPRWALIAGIASASSVPIVIGYVMATEPAAPALEPLRFFFRIGLPYLLVVLVGYVSARLIYHLSSEVFTCFTRYLEMETAPNRVTSLSTRYGILPPSSGAPCDDDSFCLVRKLRDRHRPAGRQLGPDHAGGSADLQLPGLQGAAGRRSARPDRPGRPAHRHASARRALSVTPHEERSWLRLRCHKL